MPSCQQLLGELVRAVLRAREHERLVDDPRPDQMREELPLAGPIDRVDDLADELGRRVARGDLHRCGPVEHPLCQRADLVRERRAEEEVLAPIRQQGEDRADVADEAHVEHAIGLVQDEDLDVAQVDGALPGVVEQPAGRRDDDLDPAP